MSKNKVIISFLIICLMVLTVLLIYQQKEISNLKTDIKNIISYDSNTEEKTIDDFSIQISEINSLLNDEITGVVYFGRDTCPFCSELNNIIKNNINLSNIKIYKFDTDIWRENNRFQEVLDKYGINDIPVLIKINTDLTVSIYEPDENSTDEEIISSLYQFLQLNE